MENRSLLNSFLLRATSRLPAILLRRGEKSLTLIELLIGISLLAIILLSLASLDIFSRSHLMSSVRIPILQNEASRALEHMTKYLSASIGDISGTVGVDQHYPDIRNIQSCPGIKFWVDNNNDFRLDTAVDRRSAYKLENYELKYCATCATPVLSTACNTCTSTWEILTNGVVTFVPGFTLGDNYVSVQIKVCHDTTRIADCGKTDNPQVEMQAKIKMPAVSAR